MIEAGVRPRAGSARWGEAREASPSEGGRERPPLIDKIAALEAAGIKVARTPAEMGVTLKSVL